MCVCVINRTQPCACACSCHSYSRACVRTAVAHTHSCARLTPNSEECVCVCVCVCAQRKEETGCLSELMTWSPSHMQTERPLNATCQCDETSPIICQEAMDVQDMSSFSSAAASARDLRLNFRMSRFTFRLCQKNQILSGRATENSHGTCGARSATDNSWGSQFRRDQTQTVTTNGALFPYVYEPRQSLQTRRAERKSRWSLSAQSSSPSLSETCAHSHTVGGLTAFEHAFIWIPITISTVGPRHYAE